MRMRVSLTVMLSQNANCTRCGTARGFGRFPPAVPQRSLLTVVHNHGAAARIGVIPRFLQSSVWDATDVKRLTCLPSRALEGRRGRQTIDSSAVPQILGCVRLPAAYSGCRSPPPIAPTGHHPAWRKYATRLSVGIMAAWRRRTVEEIPMMPQQPSPTHITAINRKYQEAENL